MMNTMKIFDNFLPNNYFDNLRNTMIGGSFDWHFMPYINSVDEIYDVSKFQFIHMFYDYDNGEYPFFPLLIPIIKKLGATEVIKIKANLNPREECPTPFGYHTDLDVDTDINVKTSILYLNTNNGYTLFRDGTKVECIENRLVTFDCKLEHCGVACSDSKCKLIINFNYVI